MKKLLLLFTLILTTFISFGQGGQTYFTPGVPPGSTGVTLQNRFTGTDSLAKFYFGNSNRWSQVYTAAQSNLLFAPITVGGYKAKNDTVNAQGFARNWQVINLLAGKADTSVTTYYLSQILGTKGNAAIGSAGTDYTAQIQAVFNKGANNKKIKIVWDGQYSHSGINTYSNTLIEGIPGSLSYLRDNSNRPALQNVHYRTQQNIDSNITITGMRFENNYAHQVKVITVLPDTGEWVSGIRFFGVKNLNINYTTVNHSKTFAIWCSQVSNARFEDITITQDTVTLNNQDGLHINGNSHDIFINHVSVLSNDDAVAINADDTQFGPNMVVYGTIYNCFIHNIILRNAFSGVRLLSSISYLNNIVVDGVTGKVRSTALTIDAYNLNVGLGNVGTITVKGVNVDKGHNNFNTTTQYIVINASGKVINLDGISRKMIDTTGTLISMGQYVTLQQLNITNVSSVLSPTLVKAYKVKTGNNYSDVQLGGNVINANITGYKLSGGVTNQTDIFLNFQGHIHTLNLSNIYADKSNYILNTQTGTIDSAHLSNWSSDSTFMPVNVFPHTSAGIKVLTAAGVQYGYATTQYIVNNNPADPFPNGVGSIQLLYLQDDRLTVYHTNGGAEGGTASGIKSFQGIGVGSSTEQVSIDGRDIGYNRNVVTGAIYNSAIQAQQWRHSGNATAANDSLYLSTWTGGGSSLFNQLHTYYANGTQTLYNATFKGNNLFQSSAYAGGKALVTSGKAISESATTSAQIGYLSNLTGDVNTSLNGKLDKTGGTLTGQLNLANAALAIQDPTGTGPSMFLSYTSLKVGSSNNLSHGYTSFTDGAIFRDNGSLFTISIPYANGDMVVSLTSANSDIGVSGTNLKNLTWNRGMSPTLTGTWTFNNAIFNNSAPTIVAGTTAGSISCTMPDQGAASKKVIIRVIGLQSTTLTYTFPTAFTYVPIQNLAYTGGTPAITVDATHFTISTTGAAIDGWITLEGY